MYVRSALFSALLLFVGSAAWAVTVDSTPPVATLVMPVELLEHMTVTFDEPVLAATTSNVIIAVAGNKVAGSITCFTGGASISCATGPLTSVRLTPSKPLMPGQIYTGTVNPSGATPVTDLSGNAAVMTTKVKRATILEEESSPAARFGWRKFSSSSAYGGTYVAERTRGANASMSFEGTSVTWVTRRAKTQGKAAVYIDGAQVATVNNYSSTTSMKVARTFTTATGGSHRITINVLDERGSRYATGSWVTIDAFKSGSSFLYGGVYRWDHVANSSTYGGSYRRTRSTDSRLSFTFRGRGIYWYTATGPSRGRAKVYIDGKYLKTVDNYASSTHWKVRRSVTGLSDGVHTLTLKVSATKNVKASDRWLTVDRLYVLLYTRSMFKRLGAWIDLWDYNIDPVATSRDMAAKGVKTLYIQTARFNSTKDFANETRMAAWLEAAHASGMKVVGWYLPAYGSYMSIDIRRTVAIKTYRSPGGQRFDALAIDIEYKKVTGGGEAFNEGIVEHLLAVRSAVGTGYPIGSITPAPMGMAISPSNWSGFPWGTIGAKSDVVMPMGYWSYRTDCSTKPEHCAGLYTEKNIQKARAYTGLPVHIIGGCCGDQTKTEVIDFVQASKSAKAYGGSIYDYRTTHAGEWAPLAGLNDL